MFSSESRALADPGSKARCIAITGCSGGGKTTLVSALANRGIATVQEPGRAIVREELRTGGRALPWIDPAAFVRRVLVRAKCDYDAAHGTAVFDRSLLDVLVWYYRTGTPAPEALADLEQKYRYDPTVIVFPPWPEHYTQDTERRLPYTAALEEYRALCHHLPDMGYDLTILPHGPVAARADRAIELLGLSA